MLHVPDLPDDCDVLKAALHYAENGWYVGPCRGKNPGSVLGKGWQHKTTRDADQIAAWFAGTDYGVFLHAGRSGAVIFDVDNPDAMPDVLRKALDSAPFQQSRPDEPGRGHYFFAQPAGRTIGNSNGRLGRAWGEVRGANGVVVVYPSAHPDGGEYRWILTGPVVELSGELVELLPDARSAETSATPRQVVEFLDTHTDSLRPELLNMRVNMFRRAIEDGGSRHQALVPALAGAMTEARCGYFSARTARDELFDIFVDAVTRAGAGQRSESAARDEFLSLLSWAVAQADAADLDEVRAGVEERVPNNVSEFVYVAPSNVADATIEAQECDQDPIVDQYAHLSLVEQRHERSFDQLEAEITPLADEIFEARNELSHIREAALSRGGSPLPLLADCMVRALLQVPPAVVLDSGIMTPCVLNLFTLPTGLPGDGKDGGEYAARRLVPLDEPDMFGRRGVNVVCPASGEAISDCFFFLDEDGPDGQTALTRRDAVFLHVTEAQNFLRAAGRDGSTLASVVRQGFSGQRITNKRRNRGRTPDPEVLPGSYRLCCSLSLQPSVAGPLFDDGAGLLQRQLFVPAASRGRTRADIARYQGMTIRQLRTPTRQEFLNAGTDGRIVLPPEIADAAWRLHDSNVLGLTPHDTRHRGLVVQRVMYAFTCLAGRVYPNKQDWDLAVRMVEISDLTQRWCRDAWREYITSVACERANTAGRADAVRAVAKAGGLARHKQDLRDCADAILAILKDGARLTKTVLKYKLSSALRPYLNDAMRALKTSRLIDSEPAHGGKGSVWFVTGAATS